MICYTSVSHILQHISTLVSCVKNGSRMSDKPHLVYGILQAVSKHEVIQVPESLMQQLINQKLQMG